MERLFDDRPKGGKEWAFLNIYPHLHRLEKWANDLCDELRNITWADEEPFVPNYTQISAFARRAVGELQFLKWYADRIPDADSDRFYHHFLQMGTFYEETIEACRTQEFGHLKYLFDYLESDAEWIAIEIEMLAVAAFGQWGSYFFYFAADDLADEFYQQSFTPEGLTELVRAARNFTAADPIVITPLQDRILKALHGRALKKEPLAEEVCKGQGRTLYKPGGIKELQAQGLVEHMHTVGYYRPDSPPPNAISHGGTPGP